MAINLSSNERAKKYRVETRDAREMQIVELEIFPSFTL